MEQLAENVKERAELYVLANAAILKFTETGGKTKERVMQESDSPTYNDIYYTLAEFEAK